MSFLLGSAGAALMSYAYLLDEELERLKSELKSLKKDDGENRGGKNS